MVLNLFLVVGLKQQDRINGLAVNRSLSGILHTDGNPPVRLFADHVACCGKGCLTVGHDCLWSHIRRRESGIIVGIARASVAGRNEKL